MGIKQALKRGRKLDEEVMNDSCVIKRHTGEHRTNPDTGVVEEVVLDVYRGRCWLSSSPDTGRTIQSGEHSYATETPRLHLPHDVAVRIGDVATITQTQTGNPTVGLKMTLLDLNRGTYRTSQRWNVEVKTR